MRLSNRKKIAPKCFRNEFSENNPKCMKCQHQKSCKREEYKIPDNFIIEDDDF